MRKHIVCVKAILFLSILVGVTAKDGKRSQHNTQVNQETMFADVIKNISRVNHVLQELITNYKRLQDIYKSKESIDDKSYDEEIDEVFKERALQETRDRKRKRKPRVEDTSQTPKDDNLPATQMIWSDEKENDKETEDDTDDKRIPDIQSLKIKPTSKDTSSESQSNEPTTKQPGPDIVFVETHVNTQSDRIEPTIYPYNKQISPKLRYVKEDDPAIGDIVTERIKRIEPELYMRQRNDSDGESKHKDKANIELEMETDTSVDSMSDERRYNDHNKLNGSDIQKKTAVVIVAKKNGKEQATKTSKEDEEGLVKEIFKTDVLRTAYIDACQKVAMRKCYKGCKGALSRACSMYKCKDNFKSNFKEHSKSTCIEAFHKTTQTRKNEGRNTESGKGYLQAACMPELKLPEQESLRNNNQSDSDPNSHKLNILRDKYESECQKLSAQKCEHACKSALDDTCTNTACNKELENKLRSSCYSQCLKAYKNKSTDESSRSTSSSTESTSDDSYDSSYTDDSSDSSWGETDTS